MKINAKKLPLIITMLGAVTLLLRAGLFLLGADDKGLLIPWHPFDLLCWAVTLAAVGLSIVGIAPLKGSQRYQDNFVPSIFAAAGSGLLAACIAVTVFLGWGGLTRLDLLRSISGLLTVPALLWVALCRVQGKQPPFGCHGVTCLYLTLYAVSHYQAWCSQPQLQDYAFSMAGSLLLALFGYYQTSFDVGLGKRRMQLFVGLMAGFCCLAALATTEDFLLYLGGMVWAMTGLCSLTPVKRRPFPEETNGHAAS